MVPATRIRTAAAGAVAWGEVPGAVLPSKQTGWRLPWSGLAYYIAERRRAQERAAD